MIKALLLFSSLRLFIHSAPDKEVLLLRNLMDEAHKNEKMACVFMEYTKKFQTSGQPLQRGFLAMAYFMQCDHVTGVLTKLNYFNKGKKILEQALAEDQQNIELTYFRLATQTQIPGFLHYDQQIDSDKKILINYLQNNFLNAGKDVDLYARIKDFLLHCKYCSAQEKEALARA